MSSGGRRLTRRDRDHALWRAACYTSRPNTAFLRKGGRTARPPFYFSKEDSDANGSVGSSGGSGGRSRGVQQARIDDRNVWGESDLGPSRDGGGDVGISGGSSGQCG